jgi:hypothetical protein
VTDSTRRRTWTEAGRRVLRQVNADPGQDGRPITCELLARVIDDMPWQPRPAPSTVRPGQAIRQVVRDLVLPRVDLVSYRSQALTPHGWYGIQANFSDGRARYYVLDHDHQLTVVAEDFWPTRIRAGRPSTRPVTR